MRQEKGAGKQDAQEFKSGLASTLALVCLCKIWATTALPGSFHSLAQAKLSVPSAVPLARAAQ